MITIDKLCHISSRGTLGATQECYLVSEEPYVSEPLPKDALSFDKDRLQYAQINHNDAYAGLSQFTLNVWLKPISAPPASGNVPAFIEKDNGTGQSIGIYQNAGTGAFHCGLSTGAWTAWNTTTIPVLNRWYMVTLRYDGVTFKVYVNGVEEISQAKTGIVPMTTDPWRIAYRQNTGQYLSAGVTKFKLWNYSLAPSEIADMYQAPNRCSSRAAYVHIQDYHGVEESIPGFVVSQISQTNPGKITSSIGAMLSVDAELNTQHCFIASGDSFSNEFDMIVDANDRISLTLDTIIFVRGGQTFFPEYQVGKVEYPITRRATQPLSIFTKQVPGTDHFYLDCHVMTHFSASGALSAFINAGDPIDSMVNAFISGPFTSGSGSHQCYINVGSESKVDAFIEGGQNAAAESDLYVYVVAEGVPSVDSSQNAFIFAEGPTVNLPCYIPVSDAEYSGLDAFIVGETTYPENTAVYLYIGSAGQIMRPKFAFIDGVFYYEDGVDCYIVANPVQTVAVGAMVMSSIPRVSTKRVYLRAGEPKTSGQNFYIHSNLWLREPKDSFIRGRRGVDTARGAFIYGSGNVLDSQAGFTNGYDSVRVGLDAFIYSDTVQSGAPCYIVSIGGGPIYKSAYIRNVGILSNLKVDAYMRGGITLNMVKRAYIRSVGNRASVRRVHISG